MDMAAPDVALQVLVGDEKALAGLALEALPFFCSSDRGDGRPLAARGGAWGGRDDSAAVELVLGLLAPRVPRGLFPTAGLSSCERFMVPDKSFNVIR